MAREAVSVNVVVLILALLLMAVGAGELIRWAGERAFRPECCPGRTVLLLLPGSPEDCEGLIRQAAARFDGYKALCVVKDRESREIAGRLRERYKMLEVCGPEELERLLGP